MSQRFFNQWSSFFFFFLISPPKNPISINTHETVLFLVSSFLPNTLNYHKKISILFQINPIGTLIKRDIQEERNSQLSQSGEIKMTAISIKFGTNSICSKALVSIITKSINTFQYLKPTQCHLSCD